MPDGRQNCIAKVRLVGNLYSVIITSCNQYLPHNDKLRQKSCLLSRQLLTGPHYPVYVIQKKYVGELHTYAYCVSLSYTHMDRPQVNSLSPPVEMLPLSLSLAGSCTSLHTLLRALSLPSSVAPQLQTTQNCLIYVPVLENTVHKLTYRLSGLHTHTVHLWLSSYQFPPTHIYFEIVVM